MTHFIAATFLVALIVGLTFANLTPTHAAEICPHGTVLVSLNPNDPARYWNDLFAQTFAARDKNGNQLVCATFTPDFRTLRVTDDK